MLSSVAVVCDEQNVTSCSTVPEIVVVFCHYVFLPESTALRMWVSLKQFATENDFSCSKRWGASDFLVSTANIGNQMSEVIAMLVPLDIKPRNCIC
jgi:hypothetical protein